MADVLSIDTLLSQCLFAFTENGLILPTLEEVKLDFLQSNYTAQRAPRFDPVLWSRHVSAVRSTDLFATTCELRIIAILCRVNMQIISPAGLSHVCCLYYRVLLVVVLGPAYSCC